MRPNTAPFERLGRHFVVYLARVNMCLDVDGCHVEHEQSRLHDMSDLTLGLSALPKGLRDRMLGEFADYVVSDLLVWVRGKSPCEFSPVGTFVLYFPHKQLNFGHLSVKRQSLSTLGFLRYAHKIYVP